MNKSRILNISGIQQEHNKLVIIDNSPYTIKKLVLSLNSDVGLLFFDFYHPQWSDPGAYVNVRKYNDTYIYKLGNHGWSSEWYYTSLERIIRYIHKNLNYNKYINLDEWRHEIKMEDIKTERFWSTKLSEIFRKPNQYVIYEVNGSHLMTMKDKGKENYQFNETDEGFYTSSGNEYIEDLYKELLINKHNHTQVEILWK